MVKHLATKMFKFFKKNSKQIKEWEYNVLKAVAKELPVKYSYLVDQVHPGFIVDSVPNELLNSGWKRVICDLDQYNLIKRKEVNYKISGIKVYDSHSKYYKEIQLDVFEGILIGYKIEDPDSDFDLDRIAVNNIQEKSFGNEGSKELDLILGEMKNEFNRYLDLDSTFKIEIEEGDFHVIKDLQDGNYLSMDENGAVYGMIHDPYEIEKLFDTKEAFFLALKSGRFIIEEYYNRKMS